MQCTQDRVRQAQAREDIVRCSEAQDRRGAAMEEGWTVALRLHRQGSYKGSMAVQGGAHLHSSDRPVQK